MIRILGSSTVALWLIMNATTSAAVDPTPIATPAQPANPTTRPVIDKSPVIAANSLVYRELPYVEQAHKQQQLDVYSPQGVKQAPVVIFVHGGEWTKGDKSEVSRKPKFFNENDVVFVSINYRLSGTAPHPAQADDVAAAVRWAHDHVAEYGGDPARMLLMGHSAGCHLVSLVGLDPQYLAKVGLKPSDLAGVVPWSGGAYNLPEKVEQGGMYAGYIRKTFGESIEAWRAASPMLHVEDFKPLPRFFYTSAEGDRDTSIAASRKMVELINSAGGQARFTLVPGRDHSTINHQLGETNDPANLVFLNYLEVATGWTKPQPDNVDNNNP
ncbi:MAG: hypothetical protein HJJLKODD_00306 [Phycisphaerae bacterium]|nr:hypothetical protein [Phycisphaerae bacterium]